MRRKNFFDPDFDLIFQRRRLLGVVQPDVGRDELHPSEQRGNAGPQDRAFPQPRFAKENRDRFLADDAS